MFKFTAISPVTILYSPGIGGWASLCTGHCAIFPRYPGVCCKQVSLVISNIDRYLLSTDWVPGTM